MYVHVYIVVCAGKMYMYAADVDVWSMCTGSTGLDKYIQFAHVMDKE